MATKSMKDLLVEELRDIYDAEKQALKAYPKIMKAVQNEQLKKAFETHREQTDGQVERLKQCFELLDQRPRAKHCDAMEGLIEEAQSLLDEGLPPQLLDAAILAAAQKMEHYEIAAYGTVHAYAEACGLNDVAKLLEQTLAEEKQTDELLNRIAIEDVNKKAMQAAA
ncbi:ferritin-like domain-containing protein [Aerophototrophica crusticola]|uniref:Ferritin-like domain-containing protein n=1 Tax=Aerophototrophica crusticola TaxID=1709002 RepID=A0A858R5Y9_9PROT|nr:ferritin-like domain-containing protein [Rhodospirillaceae bacterium B3]